MKELLLTLFFIIVFTPTPAQQIVNIKGKLDNFNQTDIVYMSIGALLYPLKIDEEGSFSLDRDISQFPSSFTISKISKRGKITNQTPEIWFESDSLQITVDWLSKAFELNETTPFQLTSEEIEALKGKEQITFLLENPISIPSLYFAEKQKENIDISDLEKFLGNIADEYRGTVYVKSIENYLDAKSRKPIKLGDKLEDFYLPDRDGNQVSVINKSNNTKLIAIFSSGCSYSVASIDLLEKVNDLGNEDLDLITIWDDRSKDIWLNSNQEKKGKITWTNLWDEFGFASIYLNRKMWPTFFVVNEEGELTDKFKGYSKKTLRRLKELAE